MPYLRDTCSDVRDIVRKTLHFGHVFQGVRTGWHAHHGANGAIRPVPESTCL
jgi:hypothetical protein